MGRANNIARSLGLPRDVPNAARVALTAPAQPVDVLRVETPERSLLGVEGVSAGLQAAARMRYDGENSGHLLEGVSAFAGALASYAPWRLSSSSTAGSRTRARRRARSCRTSRCFAYGFKIDPRADVADGRLAAVVLEADSRHRVARLVLSAYRGTLRRQAPRDDHARRMKQCCRARCRWFAIRRCSGRRQRRSGWNRGF